MAHNTIRNIPNFVKSYLTSKAGADALSRKPYHVYGKGQVWATSQMAHAFLQAVV